MYTVLSAAGALTKAYPQLLGRFRERKYVKFNKKITGRMDQCKLKRKFIRI
jgi:hypothetical protein